ncbi:YbaB/EbfC family DNA-binding protein [Mycolicibacterium sp.]|uniref:YbaB/EbfC family DNA-binding protein n=1 Tax=Mycolicibacterium sp. TaxID=2320850 RepID=UPI001A236E83|nr:YbaB/EbfC family DNA-binding protein [Mycolicibacterium sp.]MBJ7341934.1 YbaB/EbfC family DNA-binding protein [Mycolicibacterium sp.]
MTPDNSWTDDEGDELPGFGDAYYSVDATQSANDEGEAHSVYFTVTNPAGSVAVTAAIGGHIKRVEFPGNVTDMTESQLADEITVLAGLASQKAQAAQHAVVVELMHSMGHDRVMTSGFLEYNVGLPSPTTVETVKADIFATRYTTDQD